MLEEGAGTAESGVTKGFQLCLARSPTEQELKILLKLHQEELIRLTQDVDTAKAILAAESAIAQNPELNASEWAAYSMVASVLLNLDETITKE